MSDESAGPPVRRILLIGFMGSGKSTVGRELAERLGWVFEDFDELIETRVGVSVSEVFAVQGEAFFRDLEAEVGAELLRRDRIVLAAGGGWPLRESNWSSVDRATLSVWLHVGAGEAVRRVAADGRRRPLLAVAEPEAEAMVLLASRRPAYEKAEVSVETEGMDAAGVAHHIESLARRRGPLI